MKILELRFKNINSLYGEWIIDFTSPEYISDKIFAITGPTGAGKSTILDAISLSLFGRTPRLKAVNKTTNEIMSRQTGDCFTEITFQTNDGRFRSHWSQRRAYKKPDGDLQDSIHEVSDAVTGQVLESKKRDVIAKIEEITGMDFERFTRSMLLAQGGFAAFLEASPDHRAPILEQITGTEIYSDISKKVHERKKQESDTLKLLAAQTEGVEILDPEDESLLKNQLKQNQTREKETLSKSNAIETAIQWVEGISQLKDQLQMIDEESKSLSTELDAFHPDRERLEKARKAMDLESGYATVLSVRKQQDLDSAALREFRLKAPEFKNIMEKENTVFSDTRTTLETAKETLKKEQNLMNKVRIMDNRILDKSADLKKAEKDFHKALAELSAYEETIETIKTSRQRKKKILRKVQVYLSEHKKDATLNTQMTGIEEQLRSIDDLSCQISDLELDISMQKKRLEKMTSANKKQEDICHELKKKHDAVHHEISDIKEVIKQMLEGRLLREYRTRLKTLMKESLYQQKIADLEQARAKLEEGSPCPLCGSVHHPYAEGNIPETDELEEEIKFIEDRIQKTEELENRKREKESEEKKHRQRLSEEEKKLIHTRHEKKAVKTKIHQLESDRVLLLEKQKGKMQQLIQNVAVFGIRDIPATESNMLLKQLEIRQKNWQDHIKKKDELDQQIHEIDLKEKSVESKKKSHDTLVEEKKKVFENLKAGYETLERDRIKVFGKKNPDEEERRMLKAIGRIEEKLASDRKKKEKAKERFNEVTARIADLEKRISKKKLELEHFESEFEKDCQKQGFKSEASFISSRISSEQRQQLIQTEKNLDENKAQLVARKKDSEKKLERELLKKITGTPIEQLKQTRSELKDTLKTLSENMGAVKQKIADNETAAEKLKEKKEEINRQKTECLKWDSLHALIGSADGKKYRNFAQGLTFEVMVSHANQALRRMTDRYLLIRDDKQPLELNIMDNYQAGEIRSTKNLSGGESFIVSLSLALGLSTMASRNVTVDSLFLDEGFGTLDEDALETALNVLSGLQHEGKLIGIISHVPALKQRINTQITVRPVSGGKSMISGPGCMSCN